VRVCCHRIVHFVKNQPPRVRGLRNKRRPGRQRMARHPYAVFVAT